MRSCVRKIPILNFFRVFQVLTNLTFPGSSETIRNGFPVKFYVDICLGRFEKLFLRRKSSNIEIFQQNSLPNPCISLRVYNGFPPAPPNIFATAKNTKKTKTRPKIKNPLGKNQENYHTVVLTNFSPKRTGGVVVELWRPSSTKKIQFSPISQPGLVDFT